MEKVLQLVFELYLWFLVATCGVPASDNASVVFATTEPSNFACVLTVNNQSWIAAGKTWKVVEGQQLPEFK